MKQVILRKKIGRRKSKKREKSFNNEKEDIT